VKAESPHAGREIVLIVDDEPLVRRFASRVLHDEGFGVHEAHDGEQALAMIRTGGLHPVVVVSDIVMPRLNGVQLLESLSSVRPDLPVILMSGFGAADLAQRGIAIPCSVLAKPFPPEMLVSEVRRCIRRQLT
jgi:DNA-binding NtrC family response regulator